MKFKKKPRVKYLIFLAPLHLVYHYYQSLSKQTILHSDINRNLIIFHSLMEDGIAETGISYLYLDIKHLKISFQLMQLLKHQTQTTSVYINNIKYLRLLPL